jgi:polysaccharide deacetylase 2 family uncharacterized protein YibQ
MAASGGRSRRTRSKKRSTPDSTWKTPLLWTVTAAAIVALALWWVFVGDGFSPGDRPADLESTLRAMASTHGVAPADLRADTEIRKVDGVFVRHWQIRFPTSAAREEFIAEALILGDRESIAVGEPQVGVGRVVVLRIDHGVEAFQLELRVARERQTYTRPESITAPVTPTPTITPRPTPPPSARGRLAILLDDAGQQIGLVASAVELPDEIGVAVLPFLPASTETALAMHEAGHEVWLHLPMEAVGGSDPGPGALMVDMSIDELHDAVFMAIQNIPHLVGVNNHMGSRATADLKMMTWVMQDLASMGLAFLDSRTTVDTVAEQAARAQGVRTGRRHVFLDNERTEEAIRAQLDEAVYRARMEGEIIAIGHLSEVTIAVLADEIPRLSRRGVTLVQPTELLD